jgi:glycine dehydrogenase subunit 2
LPGPIVAKGAEGSEPYALEMPKSSIGRMCTYLGNFGVFLRAYAYIRLHGAEGLKANSLHAVLNANYLRVKLRDLYPVPFDRINMHEFVCQGQPTGTTARAIDISKRLMDFGFHPPTNYFPLIVPEALMVEPTETESKETLDAFIEAMAQIAAEAREAPDLLKAAPHTMPVGRLDEPKAARNQIVTDQHACLRVSRTR